VRPLTRKWLRAAASSGQSRVWPKQAPSRRAAALLYGTGQEQERRDAPVVALRVGVAERGSIGERERVARGRVEPGDRVLRRGDVDLGSLADLVDAVGLAVPARGGGRRFRGQSLARSLARSRGEGEGDALDDAGTRVDDGEEGLRLEVDVEASVAANKEERRDEARASVSSHVARRGAREGRSGYFSWSGGERGDAPALVEAAVLVLGVDELEVECRGRAGDRLSRGRGGEGGDGEGERGDRGVHVAMCRVGGWREGASERERGARRRARGEPSERAETRAHAWRSRRGHCLSLCALQGTRATLQAHALYTLQTAHRERELGARNSPGSSSSPSDLLSTGPSSSSLPPTRLTRRT